MAADLVDIWGPYSLYRWNVKLVVIGHTMVILSTDQAKAAFLFLRPNGWQQLGTFTSSASTETVD